MCGRYLIITTPEAMRAFFRYLEQPNFPPRYNIAPTQPIPIVWLVDGKRSFALMRWGMLPSWVEEPNTFPLLINARGESVLDKPAFRNAMRRRRCLIPTDGFYEWQAGAAGGPKQPYFVRAKRGEGGGAAPLCRRSLGRGRPVALVAGNDHAWFVGAGQFMPNCRKKLKATLKDAVRGRG